MSEIKVGDVVMLKSGGPKMTVATIDKKYMGTELHVWCDWFVQDKAPWKKEEGVFPLTSVKLAE
jgi:uncharacterized protein YodC (DUF2158 family)